MSTELRDRLRECGYCEDKLIPLMECSDDDMVEFGGFQDKESGIWFHEECFQEVQPGKQ